MYDVQYFITDGIPYTVENTPLESLAGLNPARVTRIYDRDAKVELNAEERADIIRAAEQAEQMRDDGWNDEADAFGSSCTELHARFNGRPVMRDEQGNPLMYLDSEVA